MPNRAVLCLGVDRAGSMPPLRAAASGAGAFADWARGQGCDVTLLTDSDGGRVGLSDAFRAVKAFVDAGGYEQLVVYFAGHGFLLTQGTEYWLLSDAPENPNEAINLVRSVEDARNCGIPHVVFISDACRTPAIGPPLSAVIGGSLFVAGPYRPKRGEIDTLYATQPGSPSWEIPRSQTPEGFTAVFTETLLGAVRQPRENWIESIPVPTGPPDSVRTVVTTRTLKPVLEGSVPQTAADFDVRLRQTPEVRAETALPKFFAEVDPAAARAPKRGEREPINVGTGVRAAGERILSVVPPGRGGERSLDLDLDEDFLGIRREVQRLTLRVERPSFATRSGLTVRGAEVVAVHAGGWRTESFVENDLPSVRLFPPGDGGGTSVVLGLRVPSGRVTGVVVAGLTHFVAALGVDETGRLVELNYAPSENSPLFGEFNLAAAEIRELKAFLAVAAREGRLAVEGEAAAALGDRLRQQKRLDPALGVLAAYAYAQAGDLARVASVFEHLAPFAEQTPVPFDIALLAARFPDTRAAALTVPRAPFLPLLAQGWAHLGADTPFHHPLHTPLRARLVPALWTTFDDTGLELALAASRQGELP